MMKELLTITMYGSFVGFVFDEKFDLVLLKNRNNEKKSCVAINTAKNVFENLLLGLNTPAGSELYPDRI